MAAAWQGRFVARQLPADSPLNCTDKILLPPDTLQQLSPIIQQQQRGRPVFLGLSRTMVQRKPAVTCVVLEFTAQANEMSMPSWIMEQLGLKQGDFVYARTVDLPEAEFVGLRCLVPMSQAFGQQDDPRAILESSLSRGFSTLTSGTTIPIKHGDKSVQFSVEDLEPSERCHILDAEVEVDLRYTEPAQQKPAPGILTPQAGSTARPALQLNSKIELEAKTTPQFITLDCPGSSTLSWSVGEGDVQVYASRGEDPTPENFDVTCGGEPYVREGAIELSAHSDWRVLYQTFECEHARVSFELRPKRPEPGAGTSQEEDAGATENTYRCATCGSLVPESRRALHDAYCARHNVRCDRCGAVIRKADLSNHWHCDKCPFVTSSVEEKHKHMQLFHTPLTCRCGAVHERREMPSHKREACPLRQMCCRFCGVVREAGAPASNTNDRLAGLTQHESECGSRTETCKVCGQRYALKDQQLHQQLHPQAGPSDSYKSSASSSSTVWRPSDVRRTNDPAVVRARQQAWARAGFGDGSVQEEPAQVPPATTSRNTDDDQHQVPMEQVSDYEKLVECSNQLCGYGAEPSPHPLCRSCALKAFQGTQDDRSKMKHLVSVYFKQLTQGCGWVGCRNPACATAGTSEEGNAAAIHALQLARDSMQKNSFSLCVDQEGYERAHAVSQLCNMGFGRQLAVQALERTGGDLDAAAVWSLNR